MCDKIPKVSVIVPVYNGGNHLVNLFDCLCSQTISDFEVIVVDDGSTDETEEKLKQLADQLLPFQLTTLRQPNAGVSAARNNGLSHAKGKYVCFIDVDDIISPDYLKLLLQAVATTQQNVAMGYITRKQNDLQIREHSNPVVMSKNDFLREFLYHGIRFSICAGIYSRAALEKHQLRFPEGYQYSEDVYLLWKLFALEDAVTVVPCAIYFYFDNPKSAMNRQMDLKRLQAIELMQKLEPFMRENASEFGEEFCRYVVARHHWSILWQAASRLKPFSEFLQYCGHFEMKNELKKLYTYPQRSIAWSSRLFVFSPWLYYHMLRFYVRLTNHKK